MFKKFLSLCLIIAVVSSSYIIINNPTVTAAPSSPSSRPGKFLYWPLPDDKRSITANPDSPWTRAMRGSDCPSYSNVFDAYPCYAGHRGMDVGGSYGLPIGTEVYAAASGTVVYKYEECPDSPGTQSAVANCTGTPGNNNSGFGNYIKIKHIVNNTTWYTIYAHLKQSSVTVEVGNNVSVGNKIAESGNNGASSGGHLHFEVQRENSNGTIEWDDPFGDSEAPHTSTDINEMWVRDGNNQIALASMATKSKFLDAGMVNPGFGEIASEDREDKFFPGYFSHSKTINSKNDVLALVTGGSHSATNPGLYSMDGTNNLVYKQQHTFSGNLTGLSINHVGDIDGDGFTDLILNGINVISLTPMKISYSWFWMRNNQNGGFNAPALLNQSYGLTQDKFYTADFNGDGKTDIITSNDRMSSGAGLVWYAMVSNGSSFIDAGRIYTGYFGMNSNVFLIGDINGDSKDDVVAGVGNPSIYTWYGMVSDGSKMVDTTSPMFTTWGFHGNRFFLADVTGDNKADIISTETSTQPTIGFKSYKWYVAKSNGNTFTDNGRWMDGYGGEVISTDGTTEKQDIVIPGKFRNNNSFDILVGDTHSTGTSIKWHLMYGSN